MAANQKTIAQLLEGYDSADVAYKLTLRHSHSVERWRRGQRFPQRELWGQLARVLHCTLVDIAVAYAAYRKGDA